MILELDVVDSTNRYVLTHAESLSHFTLVTAKEQTQGRGRFQRTWFSPRAKNFYGTLLIKEYPISCLPTDLTILAGLATHDLLVHYGLSRSWLKWPNDIYVDSKKIVGILAESMMGLKQKKMIFVVGIGVNLNMSQEDIQKIDRPATSYFLETGQMLDPHLFAQQIYQRLQNWWDRWLMNRESVIKEWKTRLKLIGRKIEIMITPDNPSISGIVREVTMEGSLRVELADGTIQEFVCGDVSVR